MVVKETELDDVVSVTSTDEGDDDFEHLEASGSEEMYDHHVRERAGQGKFRAFRNLMSYGSE